MPSLDSKQKNLAQRMIDFRDRMTRQQETKNPDRQLETYTLQYSAGLRTLREVALRLRKYDAKLFQDVLLNIRVLQGDLDDSGTLRRVNNDQDG